MQAGVEAMSNPSEADSVEPEAVVLTDNACASNGSGLLQLQSIIERRLIHLSFCLRGGPLGVIYIGWGFGISWKPGKR